MIIQLNASQVLLNKLYIPISKGNIATMVKSIEAWHINKIITKIKIKGLRMLVQERVKIKNNLTNKNRYDYKKPEKFVKSTIYPKIPNFIDNLLGKSLIDQK